MSSRIEQIIGEIEEYVDSCRFQPLSSTKIVVNKEELMELLRELRMKTPDEIKRYQKIINNKDAILDDARSKADAIIAEAQTKADRIISESEVMQRANEQSAELLDQTNAQAQDIIDNATKDSNDIRMGAISYADKTLENLEEIMSHLIDVSGKRYNDFISSVQSCYDVVARDRSELSPQVEPVSYAASEPASDAEDEDDEEA